MPTSGPSCSLLRTTLLMSITKSASSHANGRTAGAKLGRPLVPPEESLRRLVFRYLAAFGPATVVDVQARSGPVRLKKAVAAIKPELRVFRDEEGRELLDVPDGPIPPEDSHAPPRLLPEYDDLVLAHADRARIFPDEHRTRIFLSAERVRATILVDGFVRGAWRTERSVGTARLLIEPFEPLSVRAPEALMEEGEHLIRFIEDAAETFKVGFRDES